MIILTRIIKRFLFENLILAWANGSFLPVQYPSKPFQYIFQQLSFFFWSLSAILVIALRIYPFFYSLSLFPVSFCEIQYCGNSMISRFQRILMVFYSFSIKIQELIPV